MRANRTMGKRYIVAAFILVMIGAAIFYFMKQEPSKVKNEPIVEGTERESSAWIVDWQWETGIEDLRQMTKGLTSLQVFAAYFNKSDNLYFTEDMAEALPQIMKTAKDGGIDNISLSVVNDRINGDGTSIQKESALITRLMSSVESRTHHIDEILETVGRYDFQGIEIDYEAINTSDWDNLTVFYKELYERLQLQGKSLRIVLEPKAPLESINLPEGPIYIMMAYNLYGNHSGPGPKADHKLIRKLASRMNHIPGDSMIALSVGGFDWSEKGKVTALTEKRAAELAQETLESPKRDAASGSLSFEYRDDGGMKHTVWYADKETLSQWISVSQEAGYNNIALWRLGEWGQETLRLFK